MNFMEIFFLEPTRQPIFQPTVNDKDSPDTKLTPWK